MGEDRKGEVGKTGVEKGRSGSGDGGSKSGPTSCVYPATYKDKQGRYGAGWGGGCRCRCAGGPVLSSTWLVGFSAQPSLGLVLG